MAARNELNSRRRLLDVFDHRRRLRIRKILELMKTQITKPDHLELPKPLPTRIDGDDPINRALDIVAECVLAVTIVMAVALWSAIWFKIYAYIWNYIR